MTAGKRIVFFISAGAIGIIAAVAASCFFDVMKVSGTVMEPAVYDGSRVLINRMAYFFGDPKPGDVVAFSCDVYSEDEEGGMLLRRVAASEGDRVEIKNGSLYINDSLYEGYEIQGIYLEDMDEVTVGNNRVFVLSDTGKAVLDSRDQAVGMLRTDELEGKVWFK